MIAPSSRRVLMVFTNRYLVDRREGNKLVQNGNKVGWYLDEAAHPLKVFEKAGWQADFASPNGGVAPIDPASIESQPDDFTRSVLERAKKTLRISECDPKNYDVAFVVGGKGVMWDLTDNADLKTFMRQIYESGKLVGAVCHAGAALANIKLSDNTYLVAGKKVTAFTDAEEQVIGNGKCDADTHPFGWHTTMYGWHTPADMLKARGAVFVEKAPWASCVVRDGRIFTGQNPQSATALAESIVAALS